MRKYNPNNPRFPHRIKVYRQLVDDVFEDSDDTLVLYDGESRNFFNTTTDGDSKVVTNMRKSATPFKNEEFENIILAGDIVEAYKGKGNEILEKGIVTDCKLANFGSEIFWKYVRN